MSSIESAFIVSHVVRRDNLPHAVQAGPYTSLVDAMSALIPEVHVAEIPLEGFVFPVIYGNVKQPKTFHIPSVLGSIAAIKYIFDVIFSAVFCFLYCLSNLQKRKLVVGIDPLTCLPLTLLKFLFRFKLVFYSVDFNERRFSNPLLQYLYEQADAISTRHSDQVWVISDALKNHKKESCNVEAIYIPNSCVFNEQLYEKEKEHKKGNVLVWGGTFSTQKQVEDLFRIISRIQHDVRPDIEAVFAPMNNINLFEEMAKKHKLINYKIVSVNREEWQKITARADVGIAIYDEHFGSTKYIEPLKIWDYMMCGVPFIISKEPSTSRPVLESGVAFVLDAHNDLHDISRLKSFLSSKNLKEKQSQAVLLAREYDMKKQVNNALNRR